MNNVLHGRVIHSSHLTKEVGFPKAADDFIINISLDSVHKETGEVLISAQFSMSKYHLPSSSSVDYWHSYTRGAS